MYLILLVVLSKEKLPPIKEKKGKREDDDDFEPKVKWVPRNWTKKDPKSMSLTQRSRYCAVSFNIVT